MRKDICYKCGCKLDKTNRTKEHIPPRCLVTEKNRSKLFIVPSCKKCNIGDSKNIEYFRNWIITFTAKQNDEAREIYNNKVKRSWDYRPSIKIGLRNAIIDEEFITPSGIYLGHKKVAIGEYHRTNPILDSISKGILFNYLSDKNIKLPYNIEPNIFEDFEWNNSKMKPLIETILTVTKPIYLIPDVFSFRFLYLRKKDSTASFTFLNFYNKKIFYIWYLINK